MARCRPAPGRHDHGLNWLDFHAGDLEIGVNFEMSPRIAGGPCILYLHHCEIDGPWRLDDLRALHAALGTLLADERLSGAMGEVWVYYDAHQAEDEAAVITWIADQLPNEEE